MIDPTRFLLRIRLSIGLFMLGLAASGLSAFPLLSELDILVNLTSQNASWGPLTAGLGHVRDALQVTYHAYPFIAYGTDWLAFGHFVIALFFLGPLIDPERNIVVLYFGIFACALVVPMALISGSIREVPFYWRLVDCSFGVLGAAPLIYAVQLTKRMAAGSWTRFVIP